MVSENAQTLSDDVSSLMDLKITIPLSKATKYLHTNDFIKTEISLPTLRKMAKLDKSYNKNDLNNFTNNVWNISKIDIKVSNSKEDITLTLSPYAKSTSDEMKTLLGFKETKNKTSNTQTNNNTEITGDAYLKDIVSKAIGSKKDIKSQALACYKYYQDHHVYELTSTDVKAQYNRSFKSLWEQKSQSCGPGAATLAKMFKSIGLHGEILNGHNHYWVKVEINGKSYYCDQAGAEGTHNQDKTGGRRVMSTSKGDHTVWGGASGGSVRVEF